MADWGVKTARQCNKAQTELNMWQTIKTGKEKNKFSISEDDVFEKNLEKLVIVSIILGDQDVSEPNMPLCSGYMLACCLVSEGCRIVSCC